MPYTYYLDDKLQNHWLKTTSYTPETHLYVGLSTTLPTKSGGNVTEPGGSGYARVQCDSWANSSNGGSSNAIDVQFATATGNWGDLSHFGIWNALTGGTLLAYGALSATTTVNATTNASPKFAAGALTTTLD